MNGNQPTGILLMSYGTPQSQEDILPFYTDVRRGRPPTPEQLSELSDRYAMIGGLSPLTERTLAQVKTITERLEDIRPGKYLVRYATKHSRPKIEEAIKDFAEEGVSQFLGMVFAPHYSKLSIGEYMAKAHDVATHYGIEYKFIKSFALDKALINFLSEQIISQILMHVAAIKALERDRLSHTAQVSVNRIAVLITAHSLPTHVLEIGDPYPSELRSTAEIIADNMGLGSEFEFIPLDQIVKKLLETKNGFYQKFASYLGEKNIEIGWQIAWQSAGRTSQTWLGPDILEVISDMGKRDIKNIIICPAGFMSDHLEILYDIDIAAQNLAKEISVSLSRTQSVNDDAAVMNSLAQMIDETLTDKRNDYGKASL